MEQEITIKQYLFSIMKKIEHQFKSMFFYSGQLNNIKRMQKNSQKRQHIPVLGASRSVPYTHAQFSKDLQVYHLTSKRHPNKLYDGISNGFVQSIELQDNPSDDYSFKMRNIYMDQLDSSLNQYKNKVFKTNAQNQDFRRDYKENVNSMILSMERQDHKRQEALKSCFKRQEENQKRFINADMVKNKKIEEFINCNQSPNTLKIAKAKMFEEHFAKLKAQEQEQQKGYKIMPSSQNRTINCTEHITINNMPAPQMGNVFRQRQTNSIHEYENHRKLSHQSQYSELPNISTSNSKVLRVHNPITNPIEYHIDNPYFIGKMQKKYSGSQYN